MKRIASTASLLLNTLLFSSISFAQFSYKDEVAPVMSCTWTGFYAGANLGLVNHTMNITDTQATTFLATIQQVTNPRLTAGFQAGYRYQLNPSAITSVYGIEASLNFANAQFSKQYGSPFALYQLNSQHTLNTLFLLQLIGGIAVDRTLLFLAAGLSWSNISGTTTNLDSIAFFDSFNVGKQSFGTALGAGIEYACTDKVSVRLKVDVITPNTYSTSDSFGNRFQIANQIVQGTFAINYKFA